MLTAGTFTTVLKENKSLRSHKTGFSQFFPDPDPGGPKLTDPDPEHCRFYIQVKAVGTGAFLNLIFCVFFGGVGESVVCCFASCLLLVSISPLA